MGWKEDVKMRCMFCGLKFPVDKLRDMGNSRYLCYDCIREHCCWR